jgi:inositol-1,3,4-trisphosphate 5/6-kinase/inositol-tetrakisphosphate 1-kinase
VDAVVSLVAKKFELTLFGFDMIQNCETGEWGIVDVNFFPGFGKVPQFEKLFLEFLLSRIKKP